MPSIIIDDVRARISCNMAIGDAQETLWFSVPKAYAGLLTADTLDAFALCALLRGIKEGRDIEVDGILSERLFYNINHDLLFVLNEYLSGQKAITIRAAQIRSDFNQAGRGVVTGFSGGIDSFCNYFEHTPPQVEPGHVITHFVYNDVGSHGQHKTEQEKRIYAARLQNIDSFAAEVGILLVGVDSNLDHYIDYTFELTHTVRNAAVALLMQGHCARFLYASAYPLTMTGFKALFSVFW